MKRRGLTLRAVETASDGGISNAYLSQLLTGKKDKLGIEKLRAIAKGLGVELSELTERL